MNYHETMNYRLIHNENDTQKFIDLLPELKENEGYFLILIARKKWFPESGIPSAHKLRREILSSKDKIIPTIRQWETEAGTYTSGEITIPQQNLGVYIGYNPKDQQKATFGLIKKCLAVIETKSNNINVKSMANDVIQGSHGSKNFMDIDVDLKEGEDWLPIKEYIESIVNNDRLTFIRTNGGFHCLVLLNPDIDSNGIVIGNTEISSTYGNKWYQMLRKHPFKSELNIMSNDLIPLVGCNQGQFVPHFI